MAGGRQRRRRRCEGATARPASGAVIRSPKRADPVLSVLVRRRRFQIETAERDGRTFRMFHRETDAAKVARNRDAIFDLHARALAWMEEYTGIPYPFGKFDFVLVPAFQYGGMEHPGAILYNAEALLLDESATQNDRLDRATVIAHETAHMWFGDLVTMSWFDDVWMKEVFANFMAAKIVNPSFPEVNHDLRFLVAHYPAAYAVDRTAGANPIRQPLANLREAGSLYGAIIYQKAPIVMRQLERLVGATRSVKGCASTEGVPVRQRDVARPDRDPGRARARGPRGVEPRLGRGAGPADDPDRARRRRRTERALAFVQADPRGRGLVWPQTLAVVVGAADGAGPHRALDAPRRRRRRRGLPAPRLVLPTGGGLAYGRFGLDARSSPPVRVAPANRRPGHARRRLDHALGRAARGRGLAGAAFSTPRSRACERERRADHAAGAGLLGDAWWRSSRVERDGAAPALERSGAGSRGDDDRA